MARAVFPLLFGICGLVTIATVEHFPYIAIPFAMASVFSLYKSVKDKYAENRVIAEQTRATDQQLRLAVIAAQKLGFTRLAMADETLKTQVAEKIADAAKHLGYPPSSLRVVASDFVLVWNQQGLAKIAEAQKLIEEFTPAT